ncbi:FeS assembly protein SufD [Segniliparus rotundus DSM 44985]|uniref:FeS assembly protein SufD n=1 Tax=Segniliparus rotundus (strain ATCC BAA-972 / CDC 1076 / CIP 108378 / DSM 44985 / JCM 13578) TaxID=640132 RepID=D6ZAP1_SEGRD|nr:SufD family Fe-S cluster assembly protein [Segniliparus rotundus]ADG98777.1 FeS assembly protein SufD [Segniliparus rotundus DSM 44985]
MTLAPVLGERFASRDPEDFPAPSSHEENWRFTPLGKIREFFTAFTPDGESKLDFGAPLEGVRVQTARPASLEAFGSALVPADKVSALAMRHAETGGHIVVEAGARPAGPVLLSRVGVRGRSYAHHVVEVGAGAEVTIVAEHSGLAQIAANLEIILGDGANCTFVVVNDEDPGSTRLASYAALVGRDASYRAVEVALGGSLVRTVSTVRFAAPGGRAELCGVALSGDGQHLESRLFVDHDQPNCTSNVLYKNALLTPAARTVWVGDVRIRPAATGTLTYELNRNLLLAKGARADSVPNLEIETGQIHGAGHASTTGRFDEEQMFYLRSRGLSEDEARRLVVRGFFGEVVAKIPDESVRARIAELVEGKLAQSGWGSRPPADDAT